MKIWVILCMYVWSCCVLNFAPQIKVKYIFVSMTVCFRLAFFFFFWEGEGWSPPFYNHRAII